MTIATVKRKMQKHSVRYEIETWDFIIGERVNKNNKYLRDKRTGKGYLISKDLLKE